MTANELRKETMKGYNLDKTSMWISIYRHHMKSRARQGYLHFIETREINFPIEELKFVFDQFVSEGYEVDFKEDEENKTLQIRIGW